MEITTLNRSQGFSILPPCDSMTDAEIPEVLDSSPLCIEGSGTVDGYGGSLQKIRTFNYSDDDGRAMRTGNVWTAAAHIITAVIGSGVLSLAWSMAQLGWIAGPVALLGFAVVTYFTSLLLTDCYRSPDPVTGKRNYTYMDAVRANLGLMLVLVLYSSFKDL